MEFQNEGAYQSVANICMRGISAGEVEVTTVKEMSRSTGADLLGQDQKLH